MLYQVVIGAEGAGAQIYYVEADDQRIATDHVWKLHKPIRENVRLTVICLAGKIEKAEEKNKQEAGDE